MSKDYSFVITKAKWAHGRYDYVAVPGRRFISGYRAPTEYSGSLTGVGDARVGDVITFSTQNLEDLIKTELGRKNLNVPREHRIVRALRKGQTITMPAGEFSIGWKDIRDTVSPSFRLSGIDFYSQVILQKTNYQALSGSRDKVTATIKSLITIENQISRYIIFAQPVGAEYYLTGKEVYLAYLPFVSDNKGVYRSDARGQKLNRTDILALYPELERQKGLMFMDVFGMEKDASGQSIHVMNIDHWLEWRVFGPTADDIKYSIKRHASRAKTHKEPAVILHNFSPGTWALPRELGCDTINIPYNGRNIDINER
jgi:hypothetical protein